jgi:peptidoglycan/xylan/chitin deacetylase (PgdA/CDA1 family)
MTLTSLMYHDVLRDAANDDSGFPGADAASYKLTEHQFRRHLDMIGEALGPSTPLCIRKPSDLAQSNGSLALTFDDGGRSGVDRTAGLLEERGWRGHFFMTTNRIGEPGFMSAADLRRLCASGHIVGTHSASHPARMSKLPTALILAEWRDSCDRLADILGAPVVAASVPGGFYSLEVARMAAAAGIRVLFNSEPTRRLTALDGVSVIGRFAVTRRTSDRSITSLSRGQQGAALAQQLAWSGKKVVKQLGGEAWLRLRRKLFDLSARKT